MSNWQDVLWKLLPVLTAFGVLIVGSWLTGRARRREWIADNQKEEYRKVLAGLNRLNMVLMDHRTGAVNTQGVREATEEIMIALNTSLFVDDFLKESKVVVDVLNAMRKLENGGSLEEYHQEYWKAVNLIVNSAKKIKT